MGKSDCRSSSAAPSPSALDKSMSSSETAGHWGERKGGDLRYRRSTGGWCPALARAQLVVVVVVVPEHDFRITFVTQINSGPHIRYRLVPLRESQKATWALAKPFYVFSVDIFYGTPDHEVSTKRWRSPLRKGRDVQHREVTGGWRGAQSCPASHPSILFLNQPLASVNFQLICKVTVCFVEIIQSIFAKCG